MVSIWIMYGFPTEAIVFFRFFRPGEDPTHQLCTRCPRTFWSGVSFEIFERCFMIFFELW